MPRAAIGAILCVRCVTAVGAGEAPFVDIPADDLEWQLERGPQERLAEIKANPENRLAEFASDADLFLQACVRVTGKARAAELRAEYGLTEAQVESLYASIATVMYRAVRVGGMPCSGLPWRWGYGWPDYE